jgi:rubrerythrin
MTRTRLLKEFSSTEDARKVEETVKTGYSETSIENLTHWLAAEEDLVDSYGRLADTSDDAKKKSVFKKLQAESKANLVHLTELQKSLEKLDKARTERIDLLSGLSD